MNSKIRSDFLDAASGDCSDRVGDLNPIIIELVTEGYLQPMKPVLSEPVLGISAHEATVTFTVVGRGAITCTMDWGDSSIETVTSPAVHLYGTSETYTATLTATNELGSHTKTIEVIV